MCLVYWSKQTRHDYVNIDNEWGVFAFKKTSAFAEILRFEVEGELLQRGQKLLLLLWCGPGGGQRQVCRHRFAIWKEFYGNTVYETTGGNTEPQMCVTHTTDVQGVDYRRGVNSNWSVTVPRTHEQQWHRPRLLNRNCVALLPLPEAFIWFNDLITALASCCICFWHTQREKWKSPTCSFKHNRLWGLGTIAIY